MLKTEQIPGRTQYLHVGYLAKAQETVSKCTLVGHMKDFAGHQNRLILPFYTHCTTPIHCVHLEGYSVSVDHCQGQVPPAAESKKVKEMNESAP